MADNNNNSASSAFEGLRRYVPLAIWVILILTVIIIPFKVVGFGYLPGDDALRHAAKAVSGKSWQEILVLSPVFKMDTHFGWDWLLRQIYLWQHCSTDALVDIEVVSLFIAIGIAAMLCLKRPEAWLIAFIICSLVSDLTQRFLLGRPFVITIMAVAVIFLLWQRNRESHLKWSAVFWMTPLIALAVFLHGVWYLWVLPIAAFFFARQFRWGFVLGVSWVLGTFLGSALTGHPIEAIVQAVQVALRAMGMHPTQNTLVSELKPSGGDIFTILFIGGLLLMRQVVGLKVTPLSRHPAFWLVALSWVAGCETSRFWEDWGLPALAILIACDLQALLETKFVEDSIQRLALVCCVAVTMYAITTNDNNSRWTNPLAWRYLDQTDPNLQGWLPEKGGTLYSIDMSIFYQTFYKNPNADWRYILGFESTLMPDEDFKVYHNILWNFGDGKAYKPWADKMRPEDRLVTRGGSGDRPNIPQLEWNHPVGDYWIGRTPRTNAPASVN